MVLLEVLYPCVNVILILLFLYWCKDKYEEIHIKQTRDNFQGFNLIEEEWADDVFVRILFYKHEIISTIWRMFLCIQ